MRDMPTLPVQHRTADGLLSVSIGWRRMSPLKVRLICIYFRSAPRPRSVRQSLGTHHAEPQLRSGGGISKHTNPTLAWMVQFAMGDEGWLY